MGLRKYQATGSAYYPKRTKMEGGFLDRMGVKLNTLQDYFNNKAEYVSVAMDKKLELRYGTVVKIPEIENDYQQVIEFRPGDEEGVGAAAPRGISAVSFRAAKTARNPLHKGGILRRLRGSD